MNRGLRFLPGVLLMALVWGTTPSAHDNCPPPTWPRSVRTSPRDPRQVLPVVLEQKPDLLASEVFNIPWLVIGGTGPQADLTKEQAQARFQASMKQLVESGWARSVFTTENVCVLNANAAIASGYNTRYKMDGSVMSVGGVTYILGRSTDGWRIVVLQRTSEGHGTVRCD